MIVDNLDDFEVKKAKDDELRKQRRSQRRQRSHTASAAREHLSADGPSSVVDDGRGRSRSSRPHSSRSDRSATAAGQDLAIPSTEEKPKTPKSDRSRDRDRKRVDGEESSTSAELLSTLKSDRSRKIAKEGDGTAEKAKRSKSKHSHGHRSRKREDKEVVVVKDNRSSENNLAGSADSIDGGVEIITPDRPATAPLTPAISLPKRAGTIRQTDILDAGLDDDTLNLLGMRPSPLPSRKPASSAASSCSELRSALNSKSALLEDDSTSMASVKLAETKADRCVSADAPAKQARPQDHITQAEPVPGQAEPVPGKATSVKPRPKKVVDLVGELGKIRISKQETLLEIVSAPHGRQRAASFTHAALQSAGINFGVSLAVDSVRALPIMERRRTSSASPDARRQSISENHGKIEDNFAPPRRRSSVMGPTKDVAPNPAELLDWSFSAPSQRFYTSKLTSRGSSKIFPGYGSQGQLDDLEEF